MRRIRTTALLAVPALLLVSVGTVNANPPGYAFFPCGSGHCYRMFPHMFQEGPLFNYGPYYGYYPFAPYGPWDAYLRYNPFFYGDGAGGGGCGNCYHNAFDHLRGKGGLAGAGGLGHLHGHGGCHSCGFAHASWLQGGWFKGHAWLDGGHGHKHGGCSSCGGVAVAPPAAPSGDAAARLGGVGSSEQSAVFYSATPTLDPAIDVIPTGYVK